jgi:hypothetical protein
MAKPFIIIGIGTSGLRVIEEVQHFYFENYGTSKPDHVELLYLETDEEGGVSKNAEWGKDLKRIFLDLSDKTTMIKGLRKNKQLDTSWLPDAVSTSDTEPGASGKPAFGRTALWGKTNFDEVIEAIKSAHTRLGALSLTVKKGESKSPAVFITGSLTGGTGSGTFIDIPYMIQKTLHVKDIYGLFLLPGQPGGGGYNAKQTIYCNTYAALKTIDFYSETRKESDEIKYNLVWPDGMPVKNADSPYQITQFITQDYSAAFPAIESLSGLFKIAGLYLFLNTVGLFSKRNTRLTDCRGDGMYGKFSTFGLSAIHYPSSQIDEYYGIQLSRKMLERWIDKDEYLKGASHVKIKGSSALIRGTVNRNFENILSESFNLLDIVMIEADQQILTDIPIRAHAINKHEIDDDITDAQYLYKLFAPGETYYEAMSNNLMLGQDVLIRGIHSYIKNSVENNQNLYLAIEEIEYFGSEIINLFKYWKNTHKVSSDPAQWKRTLGTQIQWMLQNNYSLLGVQDDVLSDKMRSTLDLMKMHLMGKRIENIYNGMIKGKTTVRSDSGEELPSINKLKNIISKIKHVIGNKDQPGSNSLYARTMEIDADISDETIPVLRIFPSGSFNQEVEKIRNIYSQQHTSPSKKDIMGQDNLFEYLTKSQDTLGSRLYDDCTNKYVSIIKDLRAKEERQQQKADKDDKKWTIDKYINDNPNVASEMAKRALSPFVKINPNDEDFFIDYDSIPKVVISQSTEISKKVIKTLKAQSLKDFEDKGDHVFAIEELNNMVVFFYERALMNGERHFNPMIDLKYIDDIKRVYEKYYKGDPPRHTEKEHHLNKLPYIPFVENSKINEGS